MLVTLSGSHGTIGGGALEWHAIDLARVMLARGETRREADLPLGPILGQCCGGLVRLALTAAGPEDAAALRRSEEAECEARPTVLVFGCGHTGRALARTLALLPFATTIVDDRLDVDEVAIGPALIRLDDPADTVAAAPPGAAYVIVTHSHALDYRLAEAALGRGDAAYVGMIGSATKRARFESAYLRAGGDAARLAALTCPIGGTSVPDKRPEVIAALVAAELLRAFARSGVMPGGRSTAPSPGGRGSAAKPSGWGDVEKAIRTAAGMVQPGLTPPRASGPTLPLQGRVKTVSGCGTP